MKFFVQSEAGDGVGLVYKLQSEGHTAVLSTHSSEDSNTGDGIITKTHDWKFELDYNTIIVADAVGLGMEMDAYRQSGRSVLGGCVLADKLEMDRRYANEVATSCGLTVPEWKWYEAWDEAFSDVEFTDSKTRLVFKPGAALAGNVPSYVSSGRKDMLKMMKHYQRQTAGQPAFMLQEFVEGVDISSEGVFNGSSFMRPFFHTLETKHLMEGNKGPSGGCTGNVEWRCEGCPICDETILKVEGFLRENDYAPGCLDINAVVNDDGVYMLEFTPRFGYHSEPTKAYGLLEDYGDYLYRMSNGASTISNVRNGVAAGVSISISPWPFTGPTAKAPDGVPVPGLKDSVLEKNKFSIYELMRDEDGDFVSSGGGGILGIGIGYSDSSSNSIAEAVEQAVEVCKSLKVPDGQYRTDLAEEFIKDVEKVEKLIGKSTLV